MRLKQNDHEFKASLGYLERLCLKSKTIEALEKVTDSHKIVQIKRDENKIKATGSLKAKPKYLFEDTEAMTKTKQQ